MNAWPPQRRADGWLVALALLAVVTSTAAATAETYRDPVYGFAFDLPRGAVAESRPGEGLLARVDLPAGASTVWAIQESEQDLEIETLADSARQRLLGTLTTAVPIERPGEPPAMGGQEGALFYLAVDRREQDDQVVGFAIVRMAPRRFLTVRLTAPADVFERVRRDFEFMLDTLTFTDPQMLYRARETRLRLGHRRVTEPDRRRLLERVEPEQWYRILQDGRDLGYVRLTFKLAREFGLPGFRVVLVETIRAERGRVDRTSSFFASFDGTTELWSVRQTQRTPHARPGVPGGATRSWAQTGLRSNVTLDDGSEINRLEVTRELPSGKVEALSWPTPGAAYLGLADRYLLEPAWAIAAASAREAAREPFAVYGYDPKRFDMGYRSIVPQWRDDATVALQVRASPLAAAETRIYDAAGRRLAWTRGAQTLRRSTQAELETIWSTPTLRP